MRYLETAVDAADVSRIVTEKLEPLLSGTALTLFRALHQVAVEASEARDYSPAVSEITYFCPLEAVALALGVHRCTVYRAASELVAAGLVAHRAHYCTHRGRTRADDSLWAVRLRPVGGRRARVGYGDLKRQYRDLGADVKAGRTVWAEMRQPKDLPLRGINLDLIRAWALPPPSTQPPISSLDRRTAPRRSLQALLDVPQVERGERSAAVDLAAEALAAALRDRTGTKLLPEAFVAASTASRRDRGGSLPRCLRTSAAGRC